MNNKLKFDKYTSTYHGKIFVGEANSEMWFTQISNQFFAQGIIAEETKSSSIAGNL